MATIQSRLPAPSLKITRKETTNPTFTTNLRKPTSIDAISRTAPTSKPVQPIEQQKGPKVLSCRDIPAQPTQDTKISYIPAVKTVNGPPAAKIVNGPPAAKIVNGSPAAKIVNGPPAKIVNGPPAATTTQSASEISDTSSQTSSNSSNSTNCKIFYNVKSRVGSLENVNYKPKGGDVKIYSDKSDFSSVKPRIGSLENVKHTPKGGEVKIFSVKPDFSKAKSRVGSFDNVNHVTKGGNVKIFSSKPGFKNVHSRVGSLENIDYIPKGGDITIFDDKLNFSNVKPRIGSLDNINHTPKGGNRQIFDDKLNFSNVKSRIGSLDNINHTPKGGDRQIFDDKLNFSDVKSRIRSLDNINHTPKGGDKVIFNDKLDFSNAKPRVGSLDNIQYVPQGGNIKIFHQQLKFRDYAAPKIIARSSASSNDSPIIADDDRLSLDCSPISHLALDETPEVPEEVNNPLQEQLSVCTPKTEGLSPIIERFDIEEEYEEEGEEESSIPVYMVESELSFEVHESFQKQRKIPNEETNKHTEFSSEKVTDFVYQDFPSKESQQHYHEEEIYENDGYNDDESSHLQRDSTSIRESTIFTVNDSSLNDTDLSFEVNVLRKSILLANTDRNSVVDDIFTASPKELTPTVEIPPENDNELFNEPELTIAQQRAYDESWI